MSKPKKQAKVRPVLRWLIWPLWSVACWAVGAFFSDPVVNVIWRLWAPTLTVQVRQRQADHCYEYAIDLLPLAHGAPRVTSVTFEVELPTEVMDYRITSDAFRTIVPGVEIAPSTGQDPLHSVGDWVDDANGCRFQVPQSTSPKFHVTVTSPPRKVHVDGKDFDAPLQVTVLSVRGRPDAAATAKGYFQYERYSRILTEPLRFNMSYQGR